MNQNLDRKYELSLDVNLKMKNLIYFIIIISLSSCISDSNESMEQKMQHAYKEQFVKPKVQGKFVAYEIHESSKNDYEKYREQLIQRKYLFHLHITFPDKKYDPEKRKKVLKGLLNSKPYKVIDFESPSKKSFTIDLWGYESDFVNWKKYFKSLDPHVELKKNRNKG